MASILDEVKKNLIRLGRRGLDSTQVDENVSNAYKKLRTNVGSNIRSYKADPSNQITKNIYRQVRGQPTTKFKSVTLSGIGKGVKSTSMAYKQRVRASKTTPSYKVRKASFGPIGTSPELVGGFVADIGTSYGRTIQRAGEGVFTKAYFSQTPSPTKHPLKFLESPQGEDILNVSDFMPIGLAFGGVTAIGKKSLKGVSKLDEAAKIGKTRGLVGSVKAAENISGQVKRGVKGVYETKPNTQLMGEAQALLQEGASIKFNKVEGLDKKVAATIQEAVNLDKVSNYEAAANLYNNLAEHGTELGRGVQAFSLLEKMSPESVSLAVSRKIQRYNITAKNKIPNLTGEQTKLISDQIAKIDGLAGRNKNLAIGELQQILNGFIPSTLADKAITVWKAGLLTSLRTHERNILGNTIMSGSEVFKDIPAVLVDKALSLKTGKRSLTLAAKGTLKGGRKGLQAAGDVITKGFDPEDAIGKFDIKRVTWKKNRVEQTLKHLTDAVFRTLGGADKPFWHSSFARSLYDQAGAEAINVGKHGNKALIEALVKSPTEDMLKVATKDANYVTFHDKNMLSSVASKIKGTMSKSEWGKVVSEGLMPFTGVPSSIAEKTIAYSPIGLVKGMSKVGKILTGDIPEMQRLASQEVGRGVMGTGLFSLGAWLAAKGLMTGQPKNTKERNLWEVEGKQANSVFYNGKWRGINSIGPQNLILLAGGKYQQEMATPDGSLAKLGAGIAKDQLSQTFLQGVQGPLQAINDPERYGKSYIGNTASSVIPNIVKDVSKAFDPNQRELNTTGDYIKAGIPGLRKTLTPKRDVLGNIVKQEPSGVAAFVDLFNSKTPIDSNTITELKRLYETGNETVPSRLSATQTIKGKKVKLTPEQLDRVETGMGQVTQSRLKTLIVSPKYKSLTDDKKSDAIASLVRKARADYKDKNGDAILAGVMPANPTYKSSPEAPQTIPAKVKLAAQGIGVDPVNTIKAIFTQERMRKISGDAMILERMNNLNLTPKKGDQRDHIIALSLGGDNSRKNLVYISAEANQAKGVLETKLARQLKNGEITKKEARKKVKVWVDKYNAGVQLNISANK